MALLQALQNIFKVPDYADRLPESVKTVIKAGNFGETSFPAKVKNDVLQILVDKIAKQDIHAFRYNGIDSEIFYRGYMTHGSVIEDDYVEPPKADEVTAYPAISAVGAQTPEFDFSKFNPYDFKLPTVKTAYYMLKVYLQYHVTVTEDTFKRAFISEEGARNFVNIILGSMAESMKLDIWLILREMLQNPDNYQEAAQVEISVAGDEFTQEEAVAFVKQISLYAKALKANTSAYNKLGVLTNTDPSNLRLYIAAGVKTLIEAAQVNAFNPFMDYGVEVVEVEGWGQTGLTNGLAAVLVDKRAPFFYDWSRDKMDSYYNAVGPGGYATAWRSRGILLGFSLYRNAVMFKLTGK